MQELTLVILAAGMGRRFGGLKQMTAVDGDGNFIMDYSLFDALRAGFTRAVFVINHAIEKEFRELVGRRVEGRMAVSYAFQELEMLPEGFSLPEGRQRPWGTAHALLCAREAAPGNFAVINADDYYGPHAYAEIAAFLRGPRAQGEHMMVCYPVEYTLPEAGEVSRGVCSGQGGYLQHIEEIKALYPKAGGAAYRKEGAEVLVPAGTPISMNIWGFGPELYEGLARWFPTFLQRGLKSDPLACEFQLPTVVQELMEEGARVRMAQSTDRWHGITHRDDLPALVDSLRALRESGVYPAKLWGEKGK